MRQRGFAIIIVLATLVLLAMLAITYIMLSLTERNIVRNYMDNKRAKLIAQSGVEYAIARLNSYCMDELFYFDRVRNKEWLYFGKNNPATANVPDYQTPLKDAIYPSFRSGSIAIEGNTKGYSAIAGATYDTDLFTLRVTDSNSLIYVNNSLELDSNHPTNLNLARILNVLGDVVGVDQVKISGKLGDRIVNARPPQGYTSKQELLAVVNYDLTEFNKFKGLITLHAWVDNNVANPVPLSANALSILPASAVAYNGRRYGRGCDGNGNVLTLPLTYAPEGVTSLTDFTQMRNAAIWGLDELNPRFIEIVGRAPVNINTAPKPVLKALLQDLQGLFVIERKRFEPIGSDIYVDTMLGNKVTYQVSPPRAYSYSLNYSWPTTYLAEDYRSVAGYVYSTQAIDATYADAIANQILFCRNRLIGYDQWFGGPFRSWRQFNAFCDYLANGITLLKDTRANIFYEYRYDLTNTLPGPLDVITSSTTAAYLKARQAKADCLKANFNPNLHLNELNPDANIATLVDKTDLIVNSTEFCFSPMGYFDVESIGYILKSDKIIAESTVAAAVKLFDVYRETNQKQFLTDSSIPTNNQADTAGNRTLEVGPEPDHILDAGNQPYALSNEWDGYLSLPVIIGPAYDSTMTTAYARFVNNLNLDYRVNDGQPTGNVTTNNRADKTETVAGPYVYDSTYRLCRSYRAGQTLPAEKAQSDLRNDGVYIERHSGLAYSLSANVLKNPGVACYWIKPTFQPELAGKARSFFSVSSYILGTTTLSGPLYWRPRIFNHWFIAHYVPSGVTDPCDFAPFYGVFDKMYHPVSMVFGYSTILASETNASQNGGGRGVMTKTLNHYSHSHSPARRDFLKQWQWSHIICYWDVPSSAYFYINNKGVIDESVQYSTYTAGWFKYPWYTAGHYNNITIADFVSSADQFRIGEPTLNHSWDPRDKSKPLPYLEPSKNWTCDSTIAGFYILYGSNALTNARGFYQAGRYYKSDSNNPSTFLSKSINLKDKNMANASTVSDPNNGTAATDELSFQSTKILGVSYTWFAEDVTSAGAPILKNYYSNFESPSDLWPQVTVELHLDLDTTPEATITNDAYSAVNLTVNNDFIYKVIINPGGLLSTTLLYTPVVDDITIYYAAGVKFISYSNFE